MTCKRVYMTCERVYMTSIRARRAPHPVAPGARSRRETAGVRRRLLSYPMQTPKTICSVAPLAVTRRVTVHTPSM